MGRTGEVALSSWLTGHWYENYQIFGLTWKEMKTGKEYLMTYFPDCDSFILDFYHAVGSYLLIGGGFGQYRHNMDRNEVLN